jgi:hypothetical protein
MNNKIDDQISFDLLEEDKMESPEKYMEYPVPSSWLFYNAADTFVDVPMHLLFLGVTKTIAMDVSDWLKSNSNNNLFLNMTVGVLERINDLHLPWCKLQPYPKSKFGGWISENFLGISRVFRWFYSLLNFVPEKCMYQEPDTPLARWSKKQIVDWLSIRGLDYNGTIKDLRDSVRVYMSRDYPKVIQVVTRKTVLTMLRSYTTMITLLMKTNSSVWNA